MSHEYPRRYILSIVGASAMLSLAGCPSKEGNESSDSVPNHFSTDEGSPADRESLIVHTGERKTIERGTSESYHSITVHSAGSVEFQEDASLRIHQ